MSAAQLAPVVVGLGEVLWDRFPDGDRLGGAPANVAYHASRLGARGVVASRIGADPDGDRLAAALAAKGLDLGAVQRDPVHSTGAVTVTLSGGEPGYVIEEGAAWDHLAFTPEWAALAAGADAVCFGTLAQRGPASRRAVREFVAATRPDALRLFDVNLRQAYYDQDAVEFGLGHATVAKLNAAELETVAALLGWDERGDAAVARLLAAFPLRWLAVTRGAAGCTLHSRAARVVSAAPPVECVDAVGAGDAFSAALLVSLLAGAGPQAAADRANRVGAYVATRPGAMPDYAAPL